MIYLRGWPLVVVTAALFVGCVPGVQDVQPSSSRSVAISGVVIRNELPYPVTDVLIEVPATGGFAGCGNILPSSACSNTFQDRDYRANAMRIRWSEHGEQHRTDDFVLELPPGVSAGDTFHVEVIVFAPGQAGARLVNADQEIVSNR